MEGHAVEVGTAYPPESRQLGIANVTLCGNDPEWCSNHQPLDGQSSDKSDIKLWPALDFFMEQLDFVSWVNYINEMAAFPKERECRALECALMGHTKSGERRTTAIPIHICRWCLAEFHDPECELCREPRLHNSNFCELHEGQLRSADRRLVATSSTSPTEPLVL